MLSRYVAFYFLVVAVFVLIDRSSQCANAKTLVETRYGKLQGACKTIEVSGDPDRTESVLSWIGVPFAQPPIGPLRFMKPAELKPWSGIRNATSFSAICMQPDNWANMSEDCLYLNIYAPYRSQSAPKPLPIYIHIHGGTFVGGAGSSYQGSYPAAVGNIIVASMNYRLGPFGFLYLGEAGIDGNMGFLDQHAAVKWVHENAASFNGDPDRITLGGHSAGSFSVGYHLFYEPGLKYIRNMIFTSGAVFMSKMNFMPLEEASRRSSEVFSALGCPKNLTNRLECIQNEEVVKSESVIPESNNYWRKNVILKSPLAYYLNPMYHLAQNGIDFKESVKESFERGNFKKDIKLINGYTHDEGSYFLEGFFSSGSGYETNYTLFENILDQFYLYFPTYPQKWTKEFKESLINTYTVENQTDFLQSVIRILSEHVYICPSVDFTTFYSAFSKVYRYSYSYRSSQSNLDPVFGVPHGSDQSIWSGESLSRWTKFTQSEKLFSKQLVTYWTNFVKYDDPNVYDQDVTVKNPTWVYYDRTAMGSNPANAYMWFYLDDIKVSSDSSYLNCDFWRPYSSYPTKTSGMSIVKQSPFLVLALVGMFSFWKFFN
jgi:carboxylesterase type B